MNWTKINTDMYGKPRYVCHFLELLTEEEKENTTIDKYSVACKRANKIGGKKFHNKQYGGGIVFSSYNLEYTERHIKRLIEEAS